MTLFFYYCLKKLNVNVNVNVNWNTGREALESKVAFSTTSDQRSGLKSVQISVHDSIGRNFRWA